MRNTPTAFVPAHKQTNPEHKPGQQVNPLGFVIQPSEQTLAEYINRVKRGDAFDQVAREQHLTFDEWYAQNELATYDKTEHDCMKMSWKAAQENAPSSRSGAKE
jgi:hypothetical protein